MIPRGLIGLYAPMWFITCLCATQALFVLIAFKWRSTAGRVGVVAALYVLAHVESWAIHQHRLPVPWDIDVALMGVTYYAFGFFAKPVLSMQYRPRVIAPIALALAAGFLAAGVTGLIHYDLDLKYVAYNHILLDLVIPLTFITAVCIISHGLARLRVAASLAALGVAALTIMYLHMYVNEVLSSFFAYGILFFTVFGTLIPFLISTQVLQKSRITRRLFLGSL
jgi:hypothetical protein